MIKTIHPILILKRNRMYKHVKRTRGYQKMYGLCTTRHTVNAYVTEIYKLPFKPYNKKLKKTNRNIKRKK